MNLLKKLKSRNIAGGVASVLTAVATYAAENPAVFNGVLAAPSPLVVLQAGLGVYWVWLRLGKRRHVEAIDGPAEGPG